MPVPSSADEPLAAPPASPARRPWTPPAVRELPKLTDLTLASPIGGSGGIGGSTVFALFLAAGLLFGINACADQNLNRPTAGESREVATAQALTCRADLAAKTLDCVATAPSASAGQVIVGGQGKRVGLRSSNTSYNGTSHVFSADVSVQNESSLPMGTSDGTTKDSAGIKVFFMSGPDGVGGAASVANATGTATFTTSGQAYFKYDTLLTAQQVSNTQTWQFQLDPSTTSFTFSVLVAAQMPATSAILRWVEEPGVNGVKWQGVSGWGSDGLAVFGQFGEVYVRDSGVWRAVNDPLGQGTTGPIVGVGTKDITTFVNSGFTTRHWDGISWRSIESLSGGPGNGGLVSFVGGSGGPGACAIGFRFYCFDGNVWTNVGLPGAVSSASASTVIGGDPVVVGSSGNVWSYAGSWTEIGSPGSGQNIFGPKIIFASDASNIWTINTANNSNFEAVIRYWNGSSWATQAVPSGEDNDTGTPVGGVAFSATDAFIVRSDNNGHGHLWQWDGTSWTDIRTAAYNYNGIWARGPDDFYVAEDGGRVEHDSAGTWSFTLDSATTAAAVWMGSSTDAYLVTNTAQILRYNGTGWRPIAQTNGTITSLWASGPNDVWVARSAPVLVHVDSVGAGGASNTGSVYAFYGVNGTSASDIWAVGQTGQIYHNDGSGWTQFEDIGQVTSYDLNAVWAANPNFAVAVGVNGEIVRWNGAAWAADTSVSAFALHSVWGTSPTDVWAVGDVGLIFHYNGTSWSQVPSGTGQNLLGVWASSASEAYAVGANNTVLMYNGTSWSPVAVQSAAGGSYNAISGVHGGQVLIGGNRVLRGYR